MKLLCYLKAIPSTQYLVIVGMNYLWLVARCNGCQWSKNQEGEMYIYKIDGGKDYAGSH